MAILVRRLGLRHPAGAKSTQLLSDKLPNQNAIFMVDPEAMVHVRVGRARKVAGARERQGTYEGELRAKGAGETNARVPAGSHVK